MQIQKMSDTEYKIMEMIWDLDEPITSSDVLKVLEVIDWKKTTILTFLTRLCQKNVLRLEKKGKVNYYYRTVTRAEYLQFVTEEFLDKVHDGSIEKFVTALCGKETKANLSNEKIQELKKWLESL